MHQCRCFYCNTLFDLQLGGFPTGSLERIASEMTALFVPLMQQGDTVHLNVGLCDGYESYLFDYGLGPKTPPKKDVLRFLSDDVIVWGQNDDARIKLRNAYNKQTDFPAVEVVRKVNGRQFCYELGQRYGCGVPGSRFCALPEEVFRYVERNPDKFPLVLKAAHGGFGAGIHRVATADTFRDSEKLIRHYLLHGGLVIEPWLRRSSDISTLTEIGCDGTVGDVVLQMQRINRFGGFYGIEAPIDEAIKKKWGEELHDKTLDYANEAARCGYYGPFGCDSFIARTDNNEETLLFGIEINARFTMGMYAHCIRNLIVKGTYSLLRVVSRQKCTLPPTYEEWHRQLSEIKCRRSKNEGVILLTPLRISKNGVVKQPQLNIFFLFSETYRKVAALDEALQMIVHRSNV